MFNNFWRDALCIPAAANPNSAQTVNPALIVNGKCVYVYICERRVSGGAFFGQSVHNIRRVLFAYDYNNETMI